MALQVLDERSALPEYPKFELIETGTYSFVTRDPVDFVFPTNVNVHAHLHGCGDVAGLQVPTP